MSKLGALVIHGLFEHKGRQQDNVNWLNNLGKKPSQLAYLDMET